MVFTENKGQLADEKGNLLTDIKFYAEEAGLRLYVRANRLSFVFSKAQEEKAETGKKQERFPDRSKSSATSSMDIACLDMDFLNVNPNPVMVSEEAAFANTNYYKAHTREARITNVKSYKKLLTKTSSPI